MAETKQCISQSLLSKFHKQRDAKALEQAEENGYFFDPTTESLLSQCMEQNSQKGNIANFKLIRLSGLHLRVLGDIALCTSLSICLLANNFLSKIDALGACKSLIKLDLHSNQLTSIPSSLFWESLDKLQVLHLHDNPLGKLETVQILGSSPCLAILTLYDTPLSLKKNYRHHTVNNIWTLKALDKHVISDEEIIEDAVFTSERFTTRCLAFRIDLCPKTPSDFTFEQEMSMFCTLIAKVNSILARHSPVLIVQRCLRGYLVRRQKMGIIKKLTPGRSTEIMAHPPSTPVHPDSPAWATFAQGVGDYEYYSRKPRPGTLAQKETLKVLQPYEQSSLTQGQSSSQEDLRLNINIQKLKSGILSCLQADAAAMGKALAGKEDLGLVSGKVKEQKKEWQEEKDDKPKSKRIKDIKHFFGPMVPTLLPENEESETCLANFRLKGRKPDLLMTDATTEMILSRKEAGQLVREAETERMRREYMQPPVKVKRSNFSTTEQRLFKRAHETMGLSCLMAVHKAYKERDKAENYEARTENIFSLREDRLQGKARVNKYQEEHRAKVLKSRGLERTQIIERREKQELERLNLLDKLQKQKVQSSDLSKVKRADHCFMQEFVSQQTSVSNALLRYDYQAHTEDSKNQRQKYISTIKKNEQEQHAVVKKYLERRKLTRQTDIAKVKADLSTKLLNEAMERLIEARNRVAYLKTTQGSILASYSLPHKKCSHADPPAGSSMPLREAILEF